MTFVMMRCGHRANGLCMGQPVCVDCVCMDIDYEVTEDYLVGRMAECQYCHRSVPSHLGLPLFYYRSEKPMDTYYCGCRGWD